MPYALCPMPYARRVPHVTEKGYNTTINFPCPLTKLISSIPNYFKITYINWEDFFSYSYYH
jgi:hypothetical protein